MTNLDSTVVNVSLSTLVTDLGSSLVTIQWVISGYLLAMALMLPLSGWLVDRFGAKKVYLGCFATFTVASMFCGTAHSSTSLIFFRIFQGMAGGVLAPMAQMMIAGVAGRHMARVISYGAIPILIAPILGPVLAGFILMHASWRWLFYLNLPFGIVAMAMAFWILPDDEAVAQPRLFDLTGFLLISPGLAFFIYGLKDISTLWPSCLLGAALLAGFLVYARRKGKEAIIDVALFKGPVFKAAATTMFFSNGTLFAGQMLIPLYLMRQCHLTSTETGWIIAPIGVGMIFVLPMMGNLTDRFGCRWVSFTGALLALLTTLPLIWMSESPISLVPFCLLLCLRGMGGGLVGIPSVSAAYASVDKKDLPVATTTINIVQRLGGPLATTLVAVAMENFALHAPNSSLNLYGFAFALLAVIHLMNWLNTFRLPVWINHRADKTEVTNTVIEEMTE